VTDPRQHLDRAVASTERLIALTNAEVADDLARCERSLAAIERSRRLFEKLNQAQAELRDLGYLWASAA